MSTQPPAAANVAVNVQQAVPFFMVSNIEASIAITLPDSVFR
jgi:hypothetical protein